MSLASRIMDLAAAVRDKLNSMTPRLLPSGGAGGDVLTKASATNYDAAWTAPSGGGGGAPALGLADWWASHRIMPTITQFPPFVATALSAGTNNATITAAQAFGHNPWGAAIRSSATANSGYRYQSAILTTMYFGGGAAYKFRCKLQPTAFTNNTWRIGFHDTANQTDAVDGAYFEIIGAVLACKTASNSVRTQNPTTLTLSTLKVYTLDIDVNATGTEARFRVYEDFNPTPILDVTNTTNIPVVLTRAFGAGFVCTNSGTVAADICILYELGVGTVPGFERAVG